MKLVAAFLTLLGISIAAQAQSLDSQALPDQVRINGVEFVLIPEGWFYKASASISAGGAELAVEDPKIWLDSFYIGKYEARAKDLVRFLNSNRGVDYQGVGTSCSIGREADGQYVQFRPDDNLPATHLSWEQASQWALWMGFRLPTELEWEKAARGQDKRIFPWGNAWPDETYLNFYTNSKCSVERVDRYKKGVSPYGIYNMSGNVYEYVGTWLDHEFDRSLKDGMRNPTPADDSASTRIILKGGRWGSKADFVKIGSRMASSPDHIWRCNGTRFAIDTEAVKRHLDNGSAEIL
ncbi:formylglycine-generating enzyme family protein [Motiliproteus sp. SC1-56]|uniref:formylglycine-generating enzyme family protein n=1 Tax=Motiliproteus sp. SC1-56 TaxID=2799565 RepID=UPI001A8DA58B|nr:formylglycine-generating enzyme family protein [Motiliproteus sp. SC1-56]